MKPLPHVRSLVVLLFFFTHAAIAQQAQPTVQPTESEIKKSLDSRGDSLDPIEGIWVISSIQQFYRYDTLYDVEKYPKGAKMGVIREGDHFVSYSLSGQPTDVHFSSTDVKGVYIYKNHFIETNSDSKVSGVICKDGKMEIVYEFPESYLRYKFVDSYEEGTRVVNNTSWQRVYPEEKKAEK